MIITFIFKYETNTSKSKVYKCALIKTFKCVKFWITYVLGDIAPS